MFNVELRYGRVRYRYRSRFLLAREVSVLVERHSVRAQGRTLALCDDHAGLKSVLSVLVGVVKSCGGRKKGEGKR